jgi:hypothetical protein
MAPVLEIDRVAREAREALDVDAGVISDARVRQHRRRGLAAAGAIVGAIAASIVVLLGVSGGGPRASSANGSAGVLPTGSPALLKVAGPLAVSPRGVLYVADVASDRILVRLPEGGFRVVAGDGKVGFSGDAGQALHAELSSVSELAFSPAGSLYVVDGGRVRVIDPDGVIRTVVGNGRLARTVANGTPAHSAALGLSRQVARGGSPPSIAFSPGGTLYLSTASQQLLRLTAAGTLATVRAVVPSGPLAGKLDRNLGPIAIDNRGDIDVAGYNGWSIWQVTPDGTAHQVGLAANGQARRSGGAYPILQRAPNGAVLAENGATLVRVDDQRLDVAFAFAQRIRGEFFWLTYFAYGPHGTLYADELPGGGGFEAHQQLVSVNGPHTNLLWQQTNKAPK